jgi:hypothetical protein
MQIAIRECDICGKRVEEENCKKYQWGILLIDTEDDLKDDPLSPWHTRIDICDDCLRNKSLIKDAHN